MDEEQRAALRWRGQDFIRKFLGLAEGARDLMDAMDQVIEPGARCHLQNGDIAPPAVAMQHAASTQRVFPDLELEFEEGLFPDDRIVMRVRLTGTARGRSPLSAMGGHFDVQSAFIARITPDLTVNELWSYMNPGFAFSFPARGTRVLPPPRDAATETHARALYDSWVRSAEAGEDFVRSVATSLAPPAEGPEGHDGGVVHLGNGDVGGVAVLEDIFDRIARGLHDLSIEIDDVMFDGPYVIAPFSMSGLHRGPIGLLPPTGKRLPSSGALFARADEASRAAEVWLYVAPAYAATFPPGRR